MKTRTLITSSLALMLTACIAEGEIVIKDGDSIAFLGDSITYLGNSQKPNGYVNLVIEGLKSAGVNAVPIPAGVGGNTAKDMLARLDRDVISKKPVWMTLNCGINDSGKFSVQEFAENLANIVDQAGAAGIKVILMNTTIGAGENLDSAETLKRAQYCAEFKRLAESKKLLLVDLNSVMVRELTERNPDGAPGSVLTTDGTHLNGLGNQIVAAEILWTLGVPDPELAALRKRWADYPSAVGTPELSINDFIKLKTLAEKNGKTPEEQAAEILSKSVNQ